MGYTTETSATTQNLMCLPYAWTYTTTSPPSEIECTFDIYTLLSSIYALQRGGVRQRIMTSSASGGVWAALNYPLPIKETTAPAIFDVTNKNTQTYLDGIANKQTAFGLQNIGGIGVTVPYYHYTHSSPSAAQAVGTGAVYSYRPNTGANTARIEYQFQTATNFRNVSMYRAGADDCNFGCFVSIPLMARYVPGQAAQALAETN